MRTAGKGKNAHAGCLCGGNARRAVFDHDAVTRISTHLARRVQEKIRRRLAVLHHGGAEDMGLEFIDEAGQPQRITDALRLAGGGDAATQRQEPVQRFGYGVNRPKLGAEALEQRRAHMIKKIDVGLDAVILKQRRGHAGDAAAEKALIGLLLSHRHTEMGEHIEKDGDGDRLAVDENAVTIENQKGPGLVFHLMVTFQPACHPDKAARSSPCLLATTSSMHGQSVYGKAPIRQPPRKCRQARGRPSDHPWP
ncbi:hypothetical protein D3C87_1239620 [compost metagenome]